MATLPDQVLGWLYNNLKAVCKYSKHHPCAAQTDLQGRTIGSSTDATLISFKHYSNILPSSLEPRYTVGRPAVDISKIADLTSLQAFENGATALLLVLRGTVPVAFRGTSYRYPIAIWIQYGFPQDAPIVFVSPTQDMVVRPGQHVSVDGRVYHPYIASWQAQWEVSTFWKTAIILL